jgi:hypothetical protein
VGGWTGVFTVIQNFRIVAPIKTADLDKGAINFHLHHPKPFPNCQSKNKEAHKNLKGLLQYGGREISLKIFAPFH